MFGSEKDLFPQSVDAELIIAHSIKLGSGNLELGHDATTELSVFQLQVGKARRVVVVSIVR